ncbi:hypothetical protein Tco_0922287 [Tanacetum coccineum]|uniref:Uncharacterized protein n=1 Tax=Tanacetum coccineum TaxID=301880 RepID=A0ABQ5CYN6_9ASTR
MPVIVDWKIYQRQELNLMIRCLISVLASHSRCRSAEAVQKKEDKKGKGTAKRAIWMPKLSRKKNRSAVTDAGKVARTSGMSSFAWILSKMLPATSEHAARTRCHYSVMAVDPVALEIPASLVFCLDSAFAKLLFDSSQHYFDGAYWPLIIEEKEMPNAVRCERSKRKWLLGGMMKSWRK